MKYGKEYGELLSLILASDREGLEENARNKKKVERLEKEYNLRISELLVIIAEKRAEIDALRASVSFRFGSACVRSIWWAERYFPRAANYPFLKQLGPARLRTSPRRLRAAYRSATESSPMLNTLHPKPQEEKTATADEVDLMWGALRSRRDGAPRVLEDSERRLLAAFTEARPHGAQDPDRDPVALVRSVAMGPVLRGVAAGHAGREGRGRLLVDARTLQGGRFDGTARHGATVLESVLACRRDWTGVSLLIDPAQHPVPAALAGDVEQVRLDRVTPALLSGAAAFLQLQPFHDLRHSEVLDELLADTEVRTATIWLDAIVGTYPDHFLRGHEPFFRYQWFIERLRHYDHVLALSNAARSEVLPLVTDVERVTVTGCRNPLRSFRQMAETRRHEPGTDAHVTLFGNALPHKNVAAGLFAFAYAYFRFAGRLRLNVLANLNDEQVRYAGAFLAAMDPRLPAAVTFHRRISDVRLSAILAGSRASIIPSFHEGFSLPVLESFDFGVPIVASAIPAHRELLGPDYPLAPPDDPAALGQNLLDALNRPAVWLSRLKDAPVSRCEAQFEAAMTRFLDAFCKNRRQMIR